MKCHTMRSDERHFTDRTRYESGSGARPLPVVGRCPGERCGVREFGGRMGDRYETVWRRGVDLRPFSAAVSPRRGKSHREAESARPETRCQGQRFTRV